MTQLISFFMTYIRPILDIVVLACLLYQVYKTLFQNRVLQVVKGIIVIIALYAVAFILHLETLLWILNKLGNAFIIIIAIVFQTEIKGFFVKVGQSHLFARSRHIEGTEVDAIVSASSILSQMHRGALMVFARQTSVKSIVDTGTRINADIVSELIVTIFGTDTALHDGALIIKGKKIIAAGCYLPLTQQTGLQKSFGTRHRAAVGMTENTDAVVLVISEETSAISIAYNGKIYYNLTTDELVKNLNRFIVEGVVIAEEQEREE